MSRVLNDYIGKRFGRLFVSGLADRSLWKNKNSHWICLCDCGNQKILNSSDLRSGFVNSCGCLRKEKNSARWTTHGNSRHPLYNLWNGMVARCRNPKMPLYPRYGGSGIDVCDRWADNFLSFVDDMGPRPSENHSIDRFDGTKGYSPENCRWATSKEQAANKIYKIHQITLEQTKLW